MYTEQTMLVRGFAACAPAVHGSDADLTTVESSHRAAEHCRALYLSSESTIKACSYNAGDTLLMSELASKSGVATFRHGRAAVGGDGAAAGGKRAARGVGRVPECAGTLVRRRPPGSTGAQVECLIMQTRE